MKLSPGNVWTTVTEATLDEERWLDQYISCPETRWIGGRPEHGRYRMYSDIGHCFPTGLLPLVVRAARRDGIVVEAPYDPTWKQPGVVQRSALGWLRDYQLDAVLKVATANRRGVIKAPTGSGKTEIMVGIAVALPDIEWLFIVDSADLSLQSGNRFELRTGERVGRFEGGQWTPGTSNVTCATFQAIQAGLRRNPDVAKHFLAQMGGLVVDECHTQSAETFFEVSMLTPNASYRIGLSGTPLDRSEKDNLRVVGALGPVIHRVPAAPLIAAGLLSKATVKMVKCEQNAEKTNWRTDYREYVTRSPSRNALVVEMARAAKKPCMVFVDEARHGRELLKLMKKAGLSVIYADGHDGPSERDGKLKQLDRGSVDVLISSPIFEKGIDLPSLKSVVNAAGKSSAVKTIQRMGRGMRVSGDGDNTFEVWDVADDGHTWLEKHAQERAQVYQDEGHEVELVEQL